MEKVKNTAFLILRIPQKVKDEITRRAQESGMTVSKWIREKLIEIING